MPSKWKYPRYGEAWAECQWCGQEYPASQVWLNPRYGWQCYKCWDGIIQRDQIIQPIFPFEGTRRTPAPVIPPLEGVGTSAEPTYDYFLRDRITGTVYEVHFPPFGIVDGLIVYFTTTFPTLTVSTETDNVWDGLRGITSGWDVYVRNGELATELNSDLNLEIVDGICDFGTVANNCTVLMRDLFTHIVYSIDFSTTPPTQTQAYLTDQLAPYFFDAVMLLNGYFAVVNGTLEATLAVDPDWLIYTNDCVNDVKVSSTDVPPTGGGGSEPPTPPTLCVVNVLAVHESFDSELCATPNQVVYESFDSELCDTPNLAVHEDFAS